MNTFVDLKNRFVIEGTLRAEGAIHIGTGVASATTDAPVVRQGGQVYIPGSSLRGVLRSTAERLTLALWGPRACCVLFEDDKSHWCWAANPDLRKEMESAQGEPYTKKREEMIKDDKLCPVCQLFGSVLMAARLKVADAPVSKETSTIRRDGVGIERDSGTAAPRIKYDFEVVEREAEFGFELQLENATETDLALLYILLGELERGIEIGGKKTRGLGKVKLTGYQVEYFDSPAGLRDYLAGNRAQASKDEFTPKLAGSFRAQTGAWIPKEDAEQGE